MNRTLVSATPYTCPGCKREQAMEQVREGPMAKSWHCPQCYHRLRVESRFRPKP